MSLFSREEDDEAALIKRAELIYRIMEMIYENREKVRLGAHELEQWFSNQAHSKTEYLEVGVENGWIKEDEAGIEITPYGKAYEPEYWKTFR